LPRERTRANEIAPSAFESERALKFTEDRKAFARGHAPSSA
jgi:hypothetical protein